jgi:hypothetical protein
VEDCTGAHQSEATVFTDYLIALVVALLWVGELRDLSALLLG